MACSGVCLERSRRGGLGSLLRLSRLVSGGAEHASYSASLLVYCLALGTWPSSADQAVAWLLLGHRSPASTDIAAKGLQQMHQASVLVYMLMG